MQDVERAVREGFAATEYAFLRKARQEGLVAGTTACVALVQVADPLPRPASPAHERSCTSSTPARRPLAPTTE